MVIITAADNIYALVVYAVDLLDLVSLIPTEGQHAVYFQAVGQDFLPKMRTLHELPQIGGVAGGYHGKIR